MTKMIKHLKDISDVCEKFRLGDGISFGNHPNAIKDSVEETAKRLEGTHVSPSTSGCSPSSHDQPVTPGNLTALPLRPRQPAMDQVCVCANNKNSELSRLLAFLIENKPPHKLKVEHLRKGLRPMNVWEEVIDCKKIPLPKKRRPVLSMMRIGAWWRRSRRCSNT